MADSFESSIRGVMSGQTRGAKASLSRALLAIVEPFYRGITATRNAIFNLHLRRPRKLPVPVISVGNLTTGGTNKTPMVISIAEMLRKSGETPGILLRGYRKREGVSDEEQIYLSRFHSSDVRVLASPDRFQAGMATLQSANPPSVFVLDDGFQHRQLARDLDLVLIDATNPFGYDHVLPRGMLRESVSGLSRCDAVIITRCDQVEPDQLRALQLRCQQLAPAIPVMRSWNELEIPESVKNRKVFAFCGIGNPESFFHLLRGAGVRLCGAQSFDDHQRYSAALLSSLCDHARSAGAEAIATTEKDWMKIAPLVVDPLPCTHGRGQGEVSSAFEKPPLAPTESSPPPSPGVPGEGVRRVSPIPLPIICIKMHVKFDPQDEIRLRQMLEAVVAKK